MTEIPSDSDVKGENHSSATAPSDRALGISIGLILIVLVGLAVGYFVVLGSQRAFDLAAIQNIDHLSMDGDVPVRITFPKELRAGLPSDQNASLHITLDPLAGIRATPPFTITLQDKEQDFDLTDNEGKPVPDMLVLSNIDSAHMGQTIYLHPATASTHHTEGKLHISVISSPTNVVSNTNVVSKELTIQIESPAAANSRLVIGQVAANLGTIISGVAIALTLLGIYHQYIQDQQKREIERQAEAAQRKKEKDAEAERRIGEQLENIEELTKRNLRLALEEIIRLQASFDTWQSPAQKTTFQMWRSDLAKEINLRRLLHQAGQEIDAGHSEQSIPIFDVICTFWANQDNGELKNQIDVIRQVLSMPQPDIDEIYLDRVIEAATQLYAKYMPDTYDLIVLTLYELTSYLNKTKWGEYYKAANNIWLRSLVFDNRLYSLRQSWKDFPKHPYKFPPVWTKVQTDPDDSSDLGKLLKRLKLPRNPFGPDDMRQDDLLAEYWFGPNQWEQMLATNEPSLIHSPVRADLLAACLRMEHTCKKQDFDQLGVPVSFWIKITLPAPNPLSTASQFGLLYYILEAQIESWIQFIVNNPQSFMLLISWAQDLVLEMLFWNGHHLHLLQQIEEQERDKETSKEDRPAFQALLRRLRESEPPTSPALLTENKIIEWLSLRPTLTELTFLAILIQAEDGTAAQELAKITALVPILKRFNLIPKVFIPTLPEPVSGPWREFRLEWAMRDLYDNLIHRIKKIAGENSPEGPPSDFDGMIERDIIDDRRLVAETKDFTHLFQDPPVGGIPQPIDQAILMHAKYSLTRMLRIGNEILRARLKRGLDSPERLTMQDFDAGMGNVM